VACANDVPLETVRDRWKPLGSDGMWTKRGPRFRSRPVADLSALRFFCDQAPDRPFGHGKADRAWAK
jgi:hypothetical protein